MTHNLNYSHFVAYMSMFTAYLHLLTILYVNQQGPKIWGQLNEKGNGSSPDLF